MNSAINASGAGQSVRPTYGPQNFQNIPSAPIEPQREITVIERLVARCEGLNIELHHYTNRLKIINDRIFNENLGENDMDIRKEPSMSSASIWTAEVLVGKLELQLKELAAQIDRLQDL